MKIFIICICELLIIRNLIRFFANYCPNINLESRKAIINFFVDFGELIAAIVIPVLFVNYC